MTPKLNTWTEHNVSWYPTWYWCLLLFHFLPSETQPCTVMPTFTIFNLVFSQILNHALPTVKDNYLIAQTSKSFILNERL